MYMDEDGKVIEWIIDELLIGAYIDASKKEKVEIPQNGKTIAPPGASFQLQ